jgi:hypothetical protein
MAKHRFQVGDVVDFEGARTAQRAEPGSCEIKRLLATDGDDPQYRVKCAAEGFERVVWESQLSVAAGVAKN